MSMLMQSTRRGSTLLPKAAGGCSAVYRSAIPSVHSLYIILGPFQVNLCSLFAEIEPSGKMPVVVVAGV